MHQMIPPEGRKWTREHFIKIIPTPVVLEAAPTTAAVGRTIVQHGAPDHGPVQISTEVLEALLQHKVYTSP